jgi:hypothetical protein
MSGIYVYLNSRRTKTIPHHFSLWNYCDKELKIRWHLVTQGNIRSATNHCKRQVQAITQETGGPFQCQFQ